MTLVKPEYRLCSGRHTLLGVTFVSYSVGILRYVRISEDGKIEIRGQHRLDHFTANVEGYGHIISEATGKARQYRTFEAAARAAINKLKYCATVPR